MKQQEFHYKVEVVLEFTKDELDHLIRLSERHYDGKCKAASQQGGFLYGIRNRLNFQEEANRNSVQDTFNSYDLDTLVKIAEGEQFDRDGKIRLYDDLYESLMSVQREYEKANSILQLSFSGNKTKTTFKFENHQIFVGYQTGFGDKAKYEPFALCTKDFFIDFLKGLKDKSRSVDAYFNRVQFFNGIVAKTMNHPLVDHIGQYLEKNDLENLGYAKELIDNWK